MRCFCGAASTLVVLAIHPISSHAQSRFTAPQQSSLQGEQTSEPNGQTLERNGELEQAASRIAAREFTKAEVLLERILGSEPKNAEAITLLGVVRAEQRCYDDAEKLFRQAIELNPRLAMAHENLALLLSETGQARPALEEYELSLSLNPESVTAKQGLTALAERQALVARGNGDRQGALDILLDATTADPKESRLLLDLGTVELEMGLNQDARATFQLAHSLHAGDLQILYGLARAELAVQDMPTAESHMREYLAQRSDDATAHFGLGRVLQMLERTDEAKREFERSVELQPRQTESYYELGDIAVNEANYERAGELFRKVLAADPLHGGALTGLGIVAYRQKQYEQANEYLQSAIKSAPGYQPAHYYCALNLKRLGKDAESERELQIALDLDAQAKGAARRPPLAGPKPRERGAGEVH